MYRRQVTSAFGGPLTRAVKYIIVACLVVFFLQIIFPELTFWLALDPNRVLSRFELWRLVTWLFVHGDPLHLIFNMLMLFMFGCEIERHWGTNRLARYYFFCGLGAAAFALFPPFSRDVHIGASGAIYGVLLAYGLSFPTRTIYFMMLVPLEARYFVIVMGLLAFYFSLGDGASRVSHISHLGGMAMGYLYLRMGWGRRRLLPNVTDAYRRWRMKRLRKKFEEYYQKRGGGNGPHYTVH